MPAPHVLSNAPRAAILGGGFIGPVHAEALRRIGVSVVGVLGSSPDRAAPFAKSLGGVRIYHDLAELLGDQAVEVVHVASPNSAHVGQVTQLLESGRHVICEKPLAINSADTRKLVDLATSRPTLAAAVNYNIRYYPMCLEMRHRVARGELGRIVNVSGSYSQDWLLYASDYNWRIEPDGGTNLRAIADIGTHWMDLAQWVSGQKIESVCADLAIVHPTRRRPAGQSETFGGWGGERPTIPTAIQTEDQGSVLIRLSGGAHGAFQVSQVFAGRKNRLWLEISGTDGSMAWDSQEPNQLWVGRRDRANERIERDPTLLSAEAAGASHYPGGHAEGFPDTFKHLFLDVYRRIIRGQLMNPTFPTFADGHRELLLCEAIAQSAHEERWASVSSR